MAKNGTGAAVESTGAASGKTKRRLRRLEQRLAVARDLEAKRARQAEKAHDRGTAHRRGSVRDLEVKRRRQLDKARHRAAELEAEIAGLRARGGAGAAVPGPTAFCLRERRIVTMVDPQPMVMRNGRTGIAGTCPSCRARLARPGASA